MKTPSPIWVVICFVVIGITVTLGLYTILGFKSTNNFSDIQVSSQKSSVVPSAISLSDKIQLRAIWIATTLNIDFPSKPGLTVEAQKKELDVLLDKVKALGLNTVYFQVRGDADAQYKSNYFPWSEVLTGTQGKDPGYDPLEYCIEGAHKRELRLEAWINPYRVQRIADISKLAPNNPARLHTDWTYKDVGGGLYFDPGVPQVLELIQNGVMEIANGYNVDGIVFDDYFYPQSIFDDSVTFKKYAGNTQLDDWRRNNITSLISSVHDKIKAFNITTKKALVFGVSPSGVWANKSSNPAGSDTTAGCQSYYNLYADSRLWVKNGYLDYICPQIYWQQGDKVADYTKILDWWVSVVRGTGVRLYISHAAYKMDGGGFSANDITNQLVAAAKYPEYKGSAFYGYEQLIANTGGVGNSITACFAKK